MESLDAGFDPVAGSACVGNGLAVGAGVRLDLGTTTLTGSDQGTGLTIAQGGDVFGGHAFGRVRRPLLSFVDRPSVGRDQVILPPEVHALIRHGYPS